MMDGFTPEYLTAVMVFSFLFFGGVYLAMRLLAGAIADSETSKKLDAQEREADKR